MQQRRLLCLLIDMYVLGSILGSCTRLHPSGNTIRLATAFVSSTTVHGDTSTSMKGKMDQNDNDNDDGTINKSSAAQSESAVVSETGTIEQSNDDAAPVPLLLPSSDESNKNITSIQLGETISFAELGPIILNTDGTTRRIDNWNTMTEQEQETTWRVIKKRNAQRREQLLLQQQKQKAAEQSNNNSNTE
jgi:hypothetical protein